MKDAKAKFDEFVRVGFDEQRLGFIAEVLDRLKADRRDEVAAENSAGEMLDFLDGFALPSIFDFSDGATRHRASFTLCRAEESPATKPTCHLISTSHC